MTGKERAFCIAYAKTLNAYQSAISAGYTPTYAKIKAHKILMRPHVIVEIKRLRTRMDQMAEKSATDVVNEFSKIAFTDRVGFLKEDPERPGEFMNKAPDELSDEQRQIVEKVTMYTAEIVVIDDGKSKSIFRQEYNYVLSDKANALEKMGRHFGIFDDKLKLSATQSNPFANVTQEKLEKLKATWVQTMSEVKAIEGQFEEVKSG